MLKENVPNDVKLAQFNMWKAALLLLQDDEEYIRSQTCTMLSPVIDFVHIGKTNSNIRYQVDYIVECAYAIMSNQFVGQQQSDMANTYVWHLVHQLCIPEANNEFLVNLPFSQQTGAMLQVELFDREKDNLFREDMVDIHLSCYHLHKCLTRMKTHANFSALLQSIDTKVDAQMTRFLGMLRLNQQTSFPWIGGISNNADVFLCLYRLMLLAIILQVGGSQDRAYHTSILQIHANATVQPLLARVLHCYGKPLGSKEMKELFFLLVIDE